MNVCRGDKIIVDAGSTKTDWILLDESGNIESRLTGNGINATTNPLSYIEETISQTIKKFPSLNENKDIFFYGAGCKGEIAVNKIYNVFRSIFPNSDIHVYSDLFGTARALFQNSKGIACILGTGSNSCYYDGHDIIKNVPPLGYILGDEGSGAILGKVLLNYILRGECSKELSDKFLSKYALTQTDVINKVYNEPKPNVFLASFALFLNENKEMEEIKNLILNEFILFFKNNVFLYKNYSSLPLKFTGSIAYNFSDILREAAEKMGLKISDIIQSPITGLIDYHKKN